MYKSNITIIALKYIRSGCCTIQGQHICTQIFTTLRWQNKCITTKRYAWPL